MSTFCGDLSHAEVTALYRAAKDEYHRRHPRPALDVADDEALRLHTLDVVNFADNAVNEACGDPTRHPTDQHLRYLREQRVSS